MDISDQIKQKERELQQLKEKLQQNAIKQVIRGNDKQNDGQIDVPSSPRKEKVPARVHLGVDRGIKAKEISLKRPPSDLLTQKENIKCIKPVQNIGPSFLERMTSHRQHQEHKTSLKDTRIYRFGTGSNIGASIGHRKAATSIPTVEKYSRLKISDRYLDQETLKAEFHDKKILSVSKVYAKVYPPDYEPLDYPNYVVMGVVARKSQAKISKASSKFIMLTLTDLKLDIGVAIHRDAFDQYWKIREGTLIAILNPEIYVTEDKGRPSIALSISRSDDCIIEVGRSTDLGRCAALNSKGTQCQNWVDSSKAMYCEYHVSLGMKRSSQQRMEFNSMTSRLNEPKISTKNKYILHSNTRRDAPRKEPVIHIPAGKILLAFLGDDENDPDIAEKQRKKKEDAYKIQEETRLKLSQRPEAMLLRRYDKKGNLISEHTTHDSRQEVLDDKRPLFTPKQLRVLGFDPTNQGKSRPADVFIGHNKATEVNLKKPKIQNEESDDDLIIEN